MGHASPIRMAVLPFETMGEQCELDYLADGLTEELIASLSQIDPDHRHVIGRTSVRGYKKSTAPLTAIGAELAVDYLLEGMIGGEQERLRRAIALDPSFAWSHSMLGHVISQCGRHEEAQPVMRRARARAAVGAPQRDVVSGGFPSGRLRRSARLRAAGHRHRS
jgi:hypothetical protein